MSALVTTDRSTFAQMDGLRAGNAAIRCTRTDVLTPRSAHFDDICAELRSYGSTQKNEFEVADDAHIMLMRCDGTSSPAKSSGSTTGTGKYCRSSSQDRSCSAQPPIARGSVKRTRDAVPIFCYVFRLRPWIS
jgi:hypothetical protein